MLRVAQPLLLCPKPGVRSHRTARPHRHPRRAKTGKSFRPRPLGFSRPHDWLRGPEAGPEKRTNVMASDAARRFLLSVPLEPQLLLQAAGSPSRERRLLLLFPMVSLGLGVKGSKGRRAVTRTGGGSATSRPLTTSRCLDPWGGNLGPSLPGPAPTAASGHPVPPLGLHRSRPQPRAGWDPLPPVLRKCRFPSDPSLAQLQSSPSHIPSSPLSSTSLSSLSSSVPSLAPPFWLRFLVAASQGLLRHPRHPTSVPPVAPLL